VGALEKGGVPNWVLGAVVLLYWLMSAGPAKAFAGLLVTAPELSEKQNMGWV
jgi:hypothetical protein